MPFIDESKSFVHGFECGQIWELINQKYQFLNYIFHKANKKQVEMMCQRSGYKCTIKDIDDTWCGLYAKRNNLKLN